MALSSAQTQAIRKLLRTGATARVGRVLERHHPADAAALFTDLTPAESRLLFDALLEVRRAGDALRALPETLLRDVLERIADDKLATMISRRPPDEALWFLGLLPEERQPTLLTRLPGPLAEELQRLRRYPAGSAGAIMTPRFLALPRERTAGEAIAELQQRGETLEAIFYLYVVEAAGRLAGVVSLRQLILSPPDKPLSELMIAEPVRVDVLEDQERAAAIASRYNLLAVPVTENGGRLVGVVTVDDLIDVIHEEATEDFYRVAGVDEGEHVFAPVLRSVRKRFSWVVINLFTAFAAATVVSLFESTLSRLVVLAAFMPIVAGLGGNCGTQSLTVMVRGLALGELEFGSTIKAVARQLAIGTMLGAGAGLLTAGVVWLWHGNPWLGAAVFLAMLANMALGALAGAVIPLLLRALRFDPALGSGVLVTAFTDSFGFLAFLGLATLLLPLIGA
jgi:magnesium transporter